MLKIRYITLGEKTSNFKIYNINVFDSMMVELCSIYWPHGVGFLARVKIVLYNIFKLKKIFYVR